MHLVREALATWDQHLPQVSILVDRHTLAKRRWRGYADDGTQFGFDLAAPLSHGAIVFAGDRARYAVHQKAEPVLEVALIPRPAPVARLGWTIGNLHFPIQVTDEFIRVPDDAALRQLFERQGIPFTPCERIFEPFAKSHQHES
jgi:urease accessory protein